jgi:hypothetical protein
MKMANSFHGRADILINPALFPPPGPINNSQTLFLELSSDYLPEKDAFPGSLKRDY